MERTTSTGSVFTDKDKFYATLKKIFLVPFVIGGLFVLSYLIWYVCHVSAGGDKPFFYPRVFGDFTQVAHYAVNRDAYVSEVGSSYSALNLLIYLPFAIIFQKDLREVSQTTTTGEWGAANMTLLSSWRFWFSFVLYLAISFAILYVLLRALLAKNVGRQAEHTQKKELNSVFLLFATSSATIYCFMRGNMIFTPLAFSLAFLLWYDDEKAWKRELALICLAAAGVMKLYPLFLCAVLLYKRAWLSIARAAAYFLLFYVLPSLYYQDGLTASLKNLFEFASGENGLFQFTNMSVSGWLFKILYYPAEWLGLKLPAWMGTVSLIVGLVFLVFLAVAAVVSESAFKRALLALCAMVLVPPVSYYYIATFAILPFLEYVKTYAENTEKENKLFFIGCVIIGACPVYAGILIPRAALCFTLLAFITLLVCGVACAISVYKSGDLKKYLLNFNKKTNKREGEN